MSVRMIGCRHPSRAGRVLGILAALALAGPATAAPDPAASREVIAQAQARNNIGAVAASDVGDTDTDFVAVFEGALV